MSFFEVLKSKASDAVQSTNEIIEIGKLNIEIKNVENKLDEAYENIGRAIYDNYKDIVDLDDDVKGKMRIC